MGKPLDFCLTATAHTAQDLASGTCALQNKLTGGAVACPVSGSCESVLNSDYATVFGVPLSLLGE